LFRRILKRPRLVLLRSWTFLALAGVLLLAPGMKARVFRARETVPDLARAAAVPPITAPARLVQLPTGTRFEGQDPPPGWTHLVFKSIPKLTSGDLDTVSAQAYEIAQRIRPLMLAEVRRDGDDPSAAFTLRRVGVGLCAPGKEEGTDVVVSTMSIAGTRGEWTTKQRLILAALSYESSKARLAAATPTFALVRSPVVFLVAGRHRKLDLCYALRVDPRTGELATIVWPEPASKTDESPSATGARRLTSRVFDLPQDVHATRALGNLVVSWSFAIRGLPEGDDLELPGDLLGLASSSDESPERSAAIEQRVIHLLSKQKPEPAGMARTAR
jgi:hypothetical protein